MTLITNMLRRQSAVNDSNPFNRRSENHNSISSIDSRYSLSSMRNN